jgi:hypothetical protein
LRITGGAAAGKVAVEGGRGYPEALGDLMGLLSRLVRYEVRKEASWKISL